MTDEGVAILQSPAFNEPQHPLMVVSIVGPAREGKSTLLSLLLRHWLGDNPGPLVTFEVGHGMDSKTQGVWMWPAPISVDGKLHKLLLLDIEGCGITSSDPDTINALYCLSYLTSSVYMWNRMRSIDYYSLEQLGVLLDATSIIVPPSREETSSAAAAMQAAVQAAVQGALQGARTRLRGPNQRRADAAAGAADPEDSDTESAPDTESTDISDADIKHMREIGHGGPAFLWVVRDAMQLPDSMTPKQYFIQHTAVKSGSGHAKANKGAHALKELFHDRDMLMIPAPCIPNREQVLQHALPKLGVQFETAVVQLAVAIAARPARQLHVLQGQPLSGKLLRIVLQLAVQAINQRGRIGVGSVATGTFTISNDALIQELLEKFKDQAKERASFCDGSSERLGLVLTEIAELRDDALRDFKQQALGDYVLKRQGEAEFQQLLQQALVVKQQQAQDTHRWLAIRRERDADKLKVS
jgi:hypothetical protein